MTDPADTLPDLWSARVLEYREEPAIVSALEAASKSGLKADLSLIREMSNAFPFLREEDKATQAIRGPADLQRALGTASELQSLKDRSAEITLTYSNVLSRLERLRDIIRTVVILKPDVIKLKNDAQRGAVVSMICPVVDDRISRVKRVLSAASSVSKNVNQSFNILKLQNDIVKEMMYEAGLARAVKGKDMA